MQTTNAIETSGAGQPEALYRAALYARLSKEDAVSGRGLRSESNSIRNQKQLMLDYVRRQDDIQVVSIREDDGYTGTDFDRPQFQHMLEDIRAGRVNCVIVKDLSRFGREYINAGRYIDRLFPYYGVRLIAINDNIDTLTQKGSGNLDIVIKNLINDNYCRDISVKIRSQLQVKRRNGEFIGAHTPYGYKKSEQDKHRLVVDSCAAGVVRDIFRWKLEGCNQGAIVKRLTAQGVLSPMEYKRSQGLNYQSGFKRGGKAGWSEMAVRRILTNPAYTGTLVQGVRTRPSYKLKTVVRRDEDDWSVVENAHEAIIAPKIFRLVQRLMALDTRTSPGGELVSPLAGLLVCGDCHGPMVRKTTSSGGKKFAYYVCGNHKKGGGCSSHRISEAEIEETALRLLQEHIRIVTELEACVRAIESAPDREFGRRGLRERLAAAEAEADKYRRLKTDAYEDMKDGILSKEDYFDISGQYSLRIDEALRAEEQLRRELDAAVDGTARERRVLDLMEHKNLQALDRAVAAECIEKIKVYENRRIEAVFTHAQDFRALLEQVRSLRPLGKEAD